MLGAIRCSRVPRASTARQDNADRYRPRAFSSLSCASSHTPCKTVTITKDAMYLPAKGQGRRICRSWIQPTG